MIICEIDGSITTDEVAALAVFLLGRADDEDSQKQISVDAFLKMANDMGIALTKNQLITMSDQPPLKNIISNIEDDIVIFKGGATSQPDMTVDKARETVKKMAKRANRIN